MSLAPQGPSKARRHAGKGQKIPVFINYFIPLLIQSQMGSFPCPSSLLRFSFLLRNKLVARKSRLWRDCAEKASAGKEIHSETPACFRRMRRAHRAPLQWNTLVLRERTACPPGPRNEARLMVFACNALASGPGNAENSKGFTHGQINRLRA